MMILVMVGLGSGDIVGGLENRSSWMFVGREDVMKWEAST